MLHKRTLRGGRNGSEGRITQGRGKPESPSNCPQDHRISSTGCPTTPGLPHPQEVEKPPEKVTFTKGHPSYLPFPKRGRRSESRRCHLNISTGKPGSGCGAAGTAVGALI